MIDKAPSSIKTLLVVAVLNDNFCGHGTVANVLNNHSLLIP